MRIGVDATCWGNTRGYGRHARALIRALVRLDAESRYVLFVDSAHEPEALPPEAETCVVRASVPAAVAASANGHRSARDVWRMSRALSRPELELLLFPTVYSFVPVLSRARKILVVHDVIAEEYPELTLPRASARLLWSLKVLLGRRQADAVVTVSEYSRRGILAHFDLPPERVFVVGEAADPVFRVLEDPRPTSRLASLGLGGGRRTVVHVGGFGPHKNLGALIEAYASLAWRTDLPDLLLVFVGEHEREVFHSHFEKLQRRVEELGIGDRVVFTGYLPDEELVVLLNLATCLALPSLIEGFGLPALEAAACGCPVVATTASPLPGLLGDGALYVNPREPAELERALDRVLASPDLRRRMRGAGLAAAGRLTWDAAARRMMEVMREVAAR